MSIFNHITAPSYLLSARTLGLHDVVHPLLGVSGDSAPAPPVGVPVTGRGKPDVGGRVHDRVERRAVVEVLGRLLDVVVAPARLDASFEDAVHQGPVHVAAGVACFPGTGINQGFVDIQGVSLTTEQVLEMDTRNK